MTTTMAETTATRRPRRRITDTSTALVGYLRVSTDEQASSGLGLDAQRTAIAAAAELRGFHVLDVFDDAASGKSLQRRPGLAAALDEIAAGRAGGLIVAKLDRLSRSLLDFAALMERSRDEGWSIIAVDLGLDTTTPSGKVMSGILAVFAEFERDLISARTRDALAAKKASGMRLGRPRETADEVIARILELRDQGLTYEAVAERLAAEGVPTARGGLWTPQAVHRALKSWNNAA